ncbi:uncharacterized protein LOC142984037 [Anticarsia gemmatalis]|uniref:uncharacterized protein LOC142984037 n=1 Tax=Anticarsia gemmatalis TaxID=129554 RepID=UPI003F761F98
MWDRIVRLLQKRNCRRRCRRRAAGRRRAWRAARASATGPPPSCRTCPRRPSGRPSRAASPRCRRWRPGGAAPAPAWSWSGAAWTWSASCGPTATPTSRWTSASACDRATA